MLKRFSILFLVLIATLAFTVSCSKSDKKEAEVKKEVKASSQTISQAKVPGSVGSKAANFTLTDLQGNPTTLKDYEGKVILLNFWATWCPPCKAEIPDFIQMYDKYKSQDLVIVGVSGFRDNLSQVKSYAESAGMNYPVLFTDPNNVQKLATDYGSFRSIPTTFLIDKKGVIQHIWTGILDETEFLKKGERYLN